MTADHALWSARAFGIRVRIDGDDLELEAPIQPPQEVLELLSLHKADILRLLCPTNDGWSPEDWQVPSSTSAPPFLSSTVACPGRRQKRTRSPAV
jgi:hypothetical protein